MPENRYSQILKRIFAAHYRPGDTSASFRREEIEAAAVELGIKLPKNFGDLIYSFRFRTPLPNSIRATEPEGRHWVIKLAGKANYRFELQAEWRITPNPALLQIKIPDSTPGIIARYALDDEQALLALVRYNRLIDIFTGVASYSMQSHLRTAIKSLGQVEIDELYVGLDRRGAHYVFPLQAKVGNHRLSTVQIEQDCILCAEKFPQLICRPLGAQFLKDGAIALMEFIPTDEGLKVSQERHYRLVAKSALSKEDLERYKSTGGE